MSTNRNQERSVNIARWFHWEIERNCWDRLLLLIAVDKQIQGRKYKKRNNFVLKYIDLLFFLFPRASSSLSAREREKENKRKRSFDLLCLFVWQTAARVKKIKDKGHKTRTNEKKLLLMLSKEYRERRYCTRRKSERDRSVIHFCATKISTSWFWFAAAFRRSWINFFRSSLPGFVRGSFALFWWGWSCFNRSSITRGRLFTEEKRRNNSKASSFA